MDILDTVQVIKTENKFGEVFHLSMELDKDEEGRNRLSMVPKKDTVELKLHRVTASASVGDLMGLAEFGLNPKRKLFDAMSIELGMNQDKQITKLFIEHGEATERNDWRRSQRFMNRIFGFVPKKKVTTDRAFEILILTTSNKIARQCRRGAGDFVIMSPYDFHTHLTSNTRFSTNNIEDGVTNSRMIGTVKVGQFMHTIDVYTSYRIDRGTFVMGKKTQDNSEGVFFVEDGRKIDMRNMKKQKTPSSEEQYYIEKIFCVWSTPKAADMYRVARFTEKKHNLLNHFAEQFRRYSKIKTFEIKFKK